MSARERSVELWARTTTRERFLIVLGAIVVCVGAGWPLLYKPMTEDLARGEASLAHARALLDRGRQVVDELTGLRRDVKPARTADPTAAVGRVVDTQGLRSSVTSLELQATRVRITFAAVDFIALAAMLDVLGREEQLFVVDALIAQRVEPGQVRAELSLVRPVAQ